MVDEQAALISYDDFSKLEIRMGKVLTAERVPNTDKLLRLEVKIGTETRQLVAGIAEGYQPEDVIGKTVPVLTNLEPRVIRGVQSQGMVLCPRDESDKPVLLVPDREVPIGSPVK
jgi:methionine--tRNA ligase beta chain